MSDDNLSDPIDDADRWHLLLHNLVGTDPAFEVFEPVDHLVACTLAAERVRQFPSLQAGRDAFEELASNVSDPLVERDARSVAATLAAMTARSRPSFAELIRSVLGAELELPTEDRQTEAHDRAEEAFFAAFPDQAGRPYCAETIHDAHMRLEPEAPISDEDIRRSVNALAEVLGQQTHDRSLPAPEFAIRAFEVDPILFANVASDDAGNITMGFNTNFDPSTMPGQRGCLVVHEGTHVVQVGNWQALNKDGQLPAHQGCICPFVPTLTGIETAAEGVQMLIPGVADLEMVSDPLSHWRILSRHAYWLQMVNVYHRMDSPSYGAEEAIKDMDRWAPDYSNRRNIELTFRLVESSVPARIIGSPYALGATYIDRALQTGGQAGQNMITEAICRPVTATELAALARGATP